MTISSHPAAAQARPADTSPARAQVARRRAWQAAWRKRAITAGLETVAAMAALRLVPDTAAGRGVIFTLHHVRPPRGHDFDPNAHLSVTPQFLHAALTEIRRAGYDIVPLHDVPARLALPAGGRRFAAITLDDGYRDNMVHAAPVFRAHDAPYTVFIAKGLIERTHTMWWETVAAWLRGTDRLTFDFGLGAETLSAGTYAEKASVFDRFTGFTDSFDEDEAVRLIDSAALKNGIDATAIVDREIMSPDELRKLAADPLASLGAHSVSHRNLARLPHDELKREIAGSVDALKKWTGSRTRVFAYPYGMCGTCEEREAKAIAAAGLDLAVTTQPDVLTGHSLAAPGLLPRVSLNGYYQQPRYVRALLSGLPFMMRT